MKKCPFCGADIEDSARFCLYCMQPLAVKEQVLLRKKKKPQWLLIIAAIVTMFLMLAIIWFSRQATLENRVPFQDPLLNSTPPSNQPKPKITIGIPENSGAYFYDTIDSLKNFLEAETGYEIDFHLFDANTVSAYQYQVEDLIRENALPDILLDLELSGDMISSYGNDGVFVDLRALLEDKDKSKVFWERMDSLETDLYGSQADRVWQQMQGASGAIYAYPTVQTSLGNGFSYMPLINNNWLNRLNLPMPTTPDELVTVLQAFRDQDPNGNGNSTDEIPLLGANSGLGANMIDWLINLYISYDSSTHLSVDSNGDLYAVIATESYRNALRWIHSLVEEGLLHKNTFTYKAGQLKDVLTNTDFIGITVGHPEAILNESFLDRWTALDLYGSCIVDPLTVSLRNFITRDCDDVDAAWNILMLLSTWEGSARQMYGIPGKHWDYADEGEMTVWCMPATIQILKSNIDNLSCVGFFTYDIIDLKQANSTSNMQQLIAEIREDQMAIINQANATPGQQRSLPWLLLNEEEKAIATDITSLNTTIKSWQVSFAKGDADITNDADWNTYLMELSQNGLSAYINAYQKCYDRMYPHGH